MTLAPWQVLLGFIVTVACAWITGRYAFRSSVRVAEISVDANAFTRAEKIYTNALNRLEADVKAERAARDEVVERITALERADEGKADQIAALQADLRRKTERIELLEGDFDVLVPEFVEWDRWIKDGATPPPPILSEDARRIAMLHRKRRARLILADDNGDYVTAPDPRPPS